VFLFIFKVISCECPEVKYGRQFIENLYSTHSKIFIGEVISISKESFQIRVTKNFKGTYLGEVYTGKMDCSCSIFQMTKRNGFFIPT